MLTPANNLNRMNCLRPLVQSHTYELLFPTAGSVSHRYVLFALVGDASVVVSVEYQYSVTGVQGTLDVRQLGPLLQTVVDDQPMWGREGS